MIEVPLEMERIFRDQAANNGIAIVQDEAVELRCHTEQFGDAVFLIYWPQGQRMHMLAPKKFVAGRA